MTFPLSSLSHQLMADSDKGLRAHLILQTGNTGGGGKKKTAEKIFQIFDISVKAPDY